MPRRNHLPHPGEFSHGVNRISTLPGMAGAMSAHGRGDVTRKVSLNARDCAATSGGRGDVWRSRSRSVLRIDADLACECDTGTRAVEPLAGHHGDVPRIGSDNQRLSHFLSTGRAEYHYCRATSPRRAAGRGPLNHGRLPLIASQSVPFRTGIAINSDLLLTRR